MAGQILDTVGGTVVLEADGSLTCSCGNTTWSDGFYACTPDGLVYEEGGPPVGRDWNGHYACEDCGAIVQVPVVNGGGEIHQ